MKLWLEGDGTPENTHVFIVLEGMELPEPKIEIKGVIKFSLKAGKEYKYNDIELGLRYSNDQFAMVTRDFSGGSEASFLVFKDLSVLSLYPNGIPIGPVKEIKLTSKGTVIKFFAATRTEESESRTETVE